MPRALSEDEWTRLERLARGFCELRIRYRTHKTEGTLTPLTEAAMQRALQRLEGQMTALKEGACEEVPRSAPTLRFEILENVGRLG
ncbi:MAG: hypothetical protein AMXMBFR7_40820 [Planctomycetota bacterium]